MKSWDLNLINSKLKRTKSHGDQRGQSYASVDRDVNRPVTYYALPFRPQSTQNKSRVVINSRITNYAMIQAGFLPLGSFEVYS